MSTVPKCHIICNNVLVEFYQGSLNIRAAVKLIRALNYAYEKSISITSYPYTPTDNTQRAAYVTACQLVHDNIADVTEGQAIRNECLLKLKA